MVRTGRLAAGMIAILGVVTTIGQFAVGALPLGSAFALAVASVAVAGVVLSLPWARFPPRASLVPIFFGLVILGIPIPMPLTGYLVLLPMYSAVFLYVGLTQAPGTALWLSPFGAVSAFLQLYVAGHEYIVIPAAIALGTAVLTGETLARHLAANQRAWSVARDSLTGLGSILNARSTAEAQDRLRSSLELLLDGADVTVRRSGPGGAPAPGSSDVLVISLRVIRPGAVVQLGTVEISMRTRHGGSQSDELAAASALIEEASKILLRLQEAEELTYQAGRDPLTGLANRRTFDSELATVAAGDVVVMVDLDHFKSVNDTWGHAEGDQEILRLTRALVSFARPGDCVARVGGEEFAVILRDLATEDATAWVSRIRDHLRDHALTTFSAGVAEHRPARPGEETLGRADTALYAAKRDGRDRTCVADPVQTPAAPGRGQ